MLLNITDKLISFIIMLLFARVFGAEIYGKIVTVFALTLITASVIELGLPVFLQREISLNKSNAGDIFSTVFTAGLILFTAFFIISALFFFLLYPGIPFMLFLITSVIIYASSLISYCNKALSGLNDFKSQFYGYASSRGLTLLIFVISLFIFQSGVYFLLTVMLAGVLLNLALLLISLNKNSIRFRFSGFSFKNARAAIYTSLPLGLAVIFNLIYDKVDLLIISGLLNFKEAAFYSIGYGLFKTSSLAFSFLLVPAFTAVAALRNNTIEIRRFLKDYSFIISAICIALGLLMFIFSDKIILLLYSGDYIESSVILGILCIAIPAMGLNNLTGVTLNGMGYFKVVMYITLYAVIFNIILNFVFIPVYGIKASAVLSVLTEYFILITEFYYLRKIIKSKINDN